jgi:hypothetical protein
MKMTLTICLSLFTTLVLAQDPDATRDKREITDPALLSQLLTASCTSEKEKVKAIFHWITDNISYFRKVVRPPRRRSKLPMPMAEPIEDDGPLPALTERVAVKVLTDKQAVCEGYARLFKSLCDHAGIRSEIVTGYARADISRTENKFRSNHSWNAVCIDSTWYLLDATWASGYMAMPSGEFVKRYDSYYFLTPPEQFIRHHYPDDLRWTLLPDPPAIAEFRNMPFHPRSFYKYSIKAFFPRQGIIEAEMGDTIRLEFERNITDVDDIASDSLWDSASLVYNPVYAYIQPLPGSSPHKIYYQFPVDSESTQWLHVMYNNDAVLRYRLNIRKPKEIIGGNSPKP